MLKIEAVNISYLHVERVWGTHTARDEAVRENASISVAAKVQMLKRTMKCEKLGLERLTCPKQHSSRRARQRPPRSSAQASRRRSCAEGHGMACR